MQSIEDLSKQILIVEDEGLIAADVRNSQAWLSTTLRSVGDGIIATDTAGEIVFMNLVAERLTGWAGTAASGLFLMEVLGLYDESSGRPARNPVSDLFAGESRSYRLFSKTGADTLVDVEYFENRAPAISSLGGEGGAPDELVGAIVVLRDIAARRQMEGRLVQSQRMEAVTNMAGGLAHDFNNQLSVILGYADELCARTKGEDKEGAQEIRKAAMIAGSITGQLLTLSRRGTARLEVLNLHEVVGEVQPMIAHGMGRSRTMVADPGCLEAFVRGDRNQIKQVLLNLALNARDAMPDGGELRIGISIREIGPESAEARLYPPGQYALLRVSDTGAGMDQATLSRIFEPFFTTKAVGSGTGLGLSIVHSIVSQCGGYISAKSEIGRGTSFEILLPCVGTFWKVNDSEAAGRAPGDGPAPTVLLVEDESAVRHLMHKILERAGCQLLEAANAEDAELIAQAYSQPIHVLVSDVLMSGLTGPELAERLSPLRPGMRTLFVSGYRHDTLDQYPGDLNLLSKPFPASELLRRVRVLLDQPAWPVQ